MLLCDCTRQRSWQSSDTGLWEHTFFLVCLVCTAAKYCQQFSDQISVAHLYMFTAVVMILGKRGAVQGHMPQTYNFNIAKNHLSKQNIVLLQSNDIHRPLMDP